MDFILIKIYNYSQLPFTCLKSTMINTRLICEICLKLTIKTPERLYPKSWKSDGEWQNSSLLLNKYFFPKKKFCILIVSLKTTANLLVCNLISLYDNVCNCEILTVRSCNRFSEVQWCNWVKTWAGEFSIFWGTYISVTWETIRTTAILHF